MFTVGEALQVFFLNEWRRAQIVSVSKDGPDTVALIISGKRRPIRILVSYEGHGSDFDEWIDVDAESHRIRRINYSHTTRRVSNKHPSLACKKKHSYGEGMQIDKPPKSPSPNLYLKKKTIQKEWNYPPNLENPLHKNAGQATQSVRRQRRKQSRLKTQPRHEKNTSDKIKNNSHQINIQQKFCPHYPQKARSVFANVEQSLKKTNCVVHWTGEEPTKFGNSAANPDERNLDKKDGQTITVFRISYGYPGVPEALFCFPLQSTHDSQFVDFKINPRKLYNTEDKKEQNNQNSTSPRLCNYRWHFSLNRDALEPGTSLTFRVEMSDPTGRYLSDPAESQIVVIPL